jgi:hypothetical protein
MLAESPETTAETPSLDPEADAPVSVGRLFQEVVLSPFVFEILSPRM